MGAAHEKPYTIMIYMNGSDLESEFGAATTDLVEMLDSGLDAKNANVLILTGGANRWMNTAIPEYEVLIWQLVNENLNEIKSMGKVNMGNPDTLSEFIKYSMKNYPAKKYALIMWDHGGGTIAGFGHDEKFNDDALSLMDMKKAFDDAGLADNKLELLGFDACLMATVEMAVLSSNYARFLVAAEDLEPGDGWDYVFLNTLNSNPNISGADLGKVIVDTFMAFYGPDSDEILSLSVIDLSNVHEVMSAMGSLMEKAHHKLMGEGLTLPRRSLASTRAFRSLAVRRAETVTFGEGSPRDNYADMVDIGDMAILLYDLFPIESQAVLDALSRSVLYNMYNSQIPIWGLSTFYIYGGKSMGEESLQIYTELNMDENYTKFLHSFFNRLTGQNHVNKTITHTDLSLWQPTAQNTRRMIGLLQSDERSENLLWPKLGNYNVCLHPINTSKTTQLYAIPVEVNNKEADIIVAFNQQHPDGKIKGIRYQHGGLMQKGYDPINSTDIISIYYQEQCLNFQEEKWHKTKPFTLKTPVKLTWEQKPMDASTFLRQKNIFHNYEFLP